MKKLYFNIISFRLLLTELLFFINGIFLLVLIPKTIPVSYAGGSSHGIFSLRQVLYDPQAYFFSFSCFLLGLTFISGILIRTLLVSFYQWKVTGFILKFFFVSWNLSIFSTTFYLSFYYMAVEGIIIGAFISVSYMIFYTTRKFTTNF